MDVLHVDGQLLVVQKPAGLLAQPDHTGDADVLTLGTQVLADQTGQDDPFLGLVHRLDRPVSGIMVLARTSAAAKSLSRQFRERTAGKSYVAVVEGRLRGVGTWTDYVAKPDRQPRLVGPDHPDGKHARLQWQALAQSDGHTLLRIRLTTGRPHQIRLQSSERGHPVAGDERYGADASLSGGGIALHHAILRVEHPTRPRREAFVAPPPDRWAPLLTGAMREAVSKVLRRARPPSAEDPADEERRP